MFIKPIFCVDLHRLILLLAILIALSPLVGTLYASYRVLYQILIDNTLGINRTYAAKLADSVSEFLGVALNKLVYSIGLLAALRRYCFPEGEACRLR